MEKKKEARIQIEVRQPDGLVVDFGAWCSGKTAG